MVLFEKYGQHVPLNRQAERYAREGVPLSLSTLADQVGACAGVLEPLFRLIERHVMAAGRLHGDDTTVPVLAKGKTSTGRVWVYVRDDRPFGGADPPAAVFHFSPDRRGEHPQAHLANWTGVLQADAYGGYGKLYEGERKPAPIVEAACWAHARRKFFELADIEGAARQRARKKVAVIAPLALEAVRRMDELFAIEREANGRPASERLAVRRERSAPIVAALEDWMRAERSRLPGAAPVAKAMNYMLDRWPSFAHLLDDGRVCMTNNAAERALRGLALGRKAWLFAGSNRGGQRAAFFNSLIVSAKLNDVDPQAWLADVLGRIASHPAQRLAELLPWKLAAGPRRNAEPRRRGLIRVSASRPVNGLDAITLRGKPQVPIPRASPQGYSEAEVAAALALLPKGRRRDALGQAVARLLGEGLGGRILPFDRAAAAAYGDLAPKRQSRGEQVTTAVAQVAAIAKARGAWLVATRDAAGFVAQGLKCIDPWAS